MGNNCQFPYCKTCGFRTHADINAATNILKMITYLELAIALEVLTWRCSIEENGH
ncbi:transposase [Phormidium sp. LEGE 05292]|uniref:zinc ribbon domain-containing protein n=1 Tax=[Phormidium] sp. LEGE 05292 TaxID=767427 RepID=UPI00188191D7|nr:transposase [Phormidium sp. LEGE 05292]